MNVLIINGSPRRHGNISAMLEAIQEEAEHNGAEVTTVFVSQLQVKPCTGCMTCRKTRRCVLPEDGAQQVLSAIDRCDVLVVGAPCYWGNMPGQLKIIFDRIVYGLIGESSRGLPLPLHKGKKAILVSTCTTSFPFNILFSQSRGTIKALRAILKWTGFKVVSAIELGGTRQRPAGEKILNRCRKAIKKCM